MRKLFWIFSFAVVFGCMASCGNKTVDAVSANDSDSVVVDSSALDSLDTVEVDSLAADSVK